MADIKNDIRSAIKENLAIIGTERTIKLLREGKIRRVFLASNISKKAKDDIDYYSKLANVKVEQLNIPNEDLGTLSKRPFSISVIGIKA